MDILLCQGIRVYCFTYIWDTGPPLILPNQYNVRQAFVNQLASIQKLSEQFGSIK